MMHPGLDGRTLTQVTADIILDLTFDDQSWVRLGGFFSVREPDGTVAQFDPDQPEGGTKAETFLGEAVTVSRIDEGGALSIEFASGRSITVPADPRYEAWEVSGPKGRKIICMPGGQLAIWDDVN